MFAKGYQHSYAASDLGLHCLPMSHKKDARPIWVNRFEGHIKSTCSLPLHMMATQGPGQVRRPSALPYKRSGFTLTTSEFR